MPCLPQASNSQPGRQADWGMGNRQLNMCRLALQKTLKFLIAEITYEQWRERGGKNRRENNL